MKNWIVSAVVVIAVLIVIYFVRKYLIKKYTVELMKTLMEDEEKFFNLLDSFKIKLLFQPFNREYLRLNNYIARGADKKIKEQIAVMDKMRVDRKQRFATYQTVFQYYLSQDNETQARNMQRKMNAFVDENNLDPGLKEKMNMEIKMYFDKALSTLPYIDQNLEEASSDEDKAVWNLRKAFVLKENNRLDEAKECMKIVVECTSDPTMKKEMQDLLDNDLKDL